MNILIADDNNNVTKSVEYSGKLKGYNIICACDGVAALEIFNKEEIDLCIIDLTMPKLDGSQVIKTIRKTSKVPIIVLTADTDMQRKQSLYSLGADDYVTKPFDVTELFMKVEAIIRRHQSYDTASNVIEYNGVRINKESRTVSTPPPNCIQSTLSRTLFRVLELLLTSPGKPFTPADIYLYANETDVLSSNTNQTVRDYVKRLREIMQDDTENPKYIETIRCVGYRFKKVKQ